MPQGRVEFVKRPIYFVAGDHQRGTDTDGVVVGVFTQDVPQTKGIAVAPRATRLRMELDRNHQPTATDLFHGAAIDVMQTSKEARSHRLCIFDHAFFDKDFERRPRDSAGERVAAKRAAVLAWLQHAEDFVV